MLTRNILFKDIYKALFKLDKFSQFAMKFKKKKNPFLKTEIIFFW